MGFLDFRHLEQRAELESDAEVGTLNVHTSQTRIQMWRQFVPFHFSNSWIQMGNQTDEVNAVVSISFSLIQA